MTAEQPSTSLDDKNASLSLDAFVRSIGVRRTSSHALFLGAGASVSSGIPSAQSCILEWKRNLFLTNNPGLENQFSELSLVSVQRRIQQWLDAQNIYPPDGDSDEYGFYIQACFPISEDRRAFFIEKARNAHPHYGYRLLCHLAQANVIRSVWTTNFDGLVARAASCFNLTPIEIGIDTQERVFRPINDSELLCVSLHGDYRYDKLKNTSDELQQQEGALRRALIDELRHRSLIVCGYSGRDQSIMESLHASYSEQGTGTLYWCGYGEIDASGAIADLIAHARSRGRQAFYVPTFGFDDLMNRLALHCLEGDRREVACHEINAFASSNALSRAPFHVPEYHANTLIKGNAFEVICPTEVFSFSLKEWPTEKVWKWLREKTHPYQVVAVPFRNTVLALGTLDDIRVCFGENINGAIERAPINPEDLRYEDGVIVSLLRESFVRSIAGTAGVGSDGKSEIWLEEPLKRHQQNNTWYSIHESALIFLRSVSGKQYIIIKPSIKVLDSNFMEATRDISDPIKIHILGYQHNKPFNEAMNKWRALLFPQRRPSCFECPPGVGSGFKFHVQHNPVFSQIGLPKGGPSLNITNNIRPLIKYRGVELHEPALVFCNKRGAGTTIDIHPVRGLAANRPFDFPLTLKGFSPTLKIGVICPRTETPRMRGYLQQVNQLHRPSDTERDYLVDYQGFQQAYGLPIDIPEPDTPGWSYCNEPSGESDTKTPLSIAHQIIGSLNSIRSSCAPNVVLIFFPRRWDRFRGYRNENEAFDVHDFVKAYAVQRGMATQFLSEDTLSDTQKCRVWWWLSLALYVKGMRTPWILDGLEQATVYAGLGYCVDRNARNGNHIVLGCSHIYSAFGEGLQYRLSKIENPIFRGKNPFMSRGDAQRTGEAIRQLYFDAHIKLPRRVVLHKRTPFIKDEREGLSEGLGGVDAVDMLEITEECAMRYIASCPQRNGTISEDRFPVRRGTAIKLDSYNALLWVHGATAGVNPPRKYFQGKRRIPAPLMLKRHVGSAPLDQLATEILGLSKMNWNTFDFYSKIPATIQSSNEIARIGSLLQRFGSTSYDYRLFI